MSYSVKAIIGFFLTAFVFSCVDRLDFIIPVSLSKGIVVDGLITDQPGPYTVTIKYQADMDAPLAGSKPYSAKKVEIIDDDGQVEELREVDSGVYSTRDDGIQGEVGRSYRLRITGRDGTVFESTEERLYAVGEIEKIYYQFEAFQPKDRPTEYGYRIFVDSKTVEEKDVYVRWRFLGTYVVETKPRYHISEDYGCVYDPLPCSGHRTVAGVVQYVQECYCCRCYVPQYEDRPTVSGKQLVQNGRFSKVEVGFVPINYYTFYERYRVEVQQMSISRTAFDFWKSIRDQQEAISSIFQPVSGRIPTNLKAVKGTGNIGGIFYASAISRKHIYLDKSTNRVDVRTPVDCLGRSGPSGESCLVKFPNASTAPPPDWID